MENNRIDTQVLKFLVDNYLSIDKDRTTIEAFLEQKGLILEDAKKAAFFIRTSSPDVFAVGRKICEVVVNYPEKKVWE